MKDCLKVKEKSWKYLYEIISVKFKIFEKIYENETLEHFSQI